MRQVVVILTVAALLALATGCEKRYNSEESLTLLDLKVGQQYEVKTAGAFYTKGVLVDLEGDWIKMDYRDNPANGWAKILWIPQREIQWIGQAEGQVQ